MYEHPGPAPRLSPYMLAAAAMEGAGCKTHIWVLSQPCSLGCPNLFGLTMASKELSSRKYQRAPFPLPMPAHPSWKCLYIGEDQADYGPWCAQRGFSAGIIHCQVIPFTPAQPPFSTEAAPPLPAAPTVPRSQGAVGQSSWGPAVVCAEALSQPNAPSLGHGTLVEPPTRLHPGLSSVLLGPGPAWSSPPWTMY